MARAKVFDKTSGSWIYADKSFGKDGKTPVKGIDYYTEAEKEELMTQILAKLPNGANASDLFIVTFGYDGVTKIASHTSDEIRDAANSGKIVVGIHIDGTTTEIAPLVRNDAGSICFQYIFGTNEYMGRPKVPAVVFTTITPTIDKSFRIERGETAPIPKYTNLDTGKILALGSSGPEWTEQEQNNAIAEIPTFNLTEMGLPDIPIDGSTVQCECDTTELRAALKQGIVKLKSRVNNGEYTFEAECLAMHTMSVDEDIHETVVRGMLWGKMYEFIMWVYADGITVTCVEANSGGNVDLTGYATEQFVRDGYQPKGNYLMHSELSDAVDDALAQAKASGEFNGKDGADGKTPLKAVDYYTEAEKEELIAEILDSLPEGENASNVLVVNIDTLNLKSSHTATEIGEAIGQGKIVFGKSGNVFYTFGGYFLNVLKGECATFYQFRFSNSNYKDYSIEAVTVWNDASISYKPLSTSFVPTVESQTPKGAVLTVTDSKLAWVLPEESGAPDAILYTAQDLTEEQKSQARQNIGIPVPTEADYGKVLSATSEGLKWVNPSGGADLPAAEELMFG